MSGPDDPRLTILVLARVVDSLGDLTMVTEHEIENMFAVDLAFLQDFYGVINFGSQEEFDALVAAQEQSMLVGDDRPAPPAPAVVAESQPRVEPAYGDVAAPVEQQAVTDQQAVAEQRPTRSSVEYAPRKIG